MEQKIGEMMTGRVDAEKLAIEHVRQPGQRMPVAGVGGAESGTNRVPMQPAQDHRVFGHIVRIIIIDEAVLKHGPIGGKGECAQEEAGQEGGASGREAAAPLAGWCSLRPILFCFTIWHTGPKRVTIWNSPTLACAVYLAGKKRPGRGKLKAIVARDHPGDSLRPGGFATHGAPLDNAFTPAIEPREAFGVRGIPALSMALVHAQSAGMPRTPNASRHPRTTVRTHGLESRWRQYQDASRRTAEHFFPLHRAKR